MHKYELAVLAALKDGRPLDLDSLVERSGIKRDSVLWAIENLSSHALITITKEESDTAELTAEGREYAKSSLPEQALLERLEKGTVKIQDLKSEKERIGMQWLKRKGIAEIKNGVLELTSASATALGEGIPEDKVLKEIAADPSSYSKIAKRNKDAAESLAKRNLLTVKKSTAVKEISITKQGASALSGAKEGAQGIDALDRSAIMSGSWKGKEFKKYDVNVPVAAAEAGRMHPLRGLIYNIKEAYTSMGFREMSGPIVEPAFWSFDSLFVPQDHPSRTVMDTFYLSNPERIVVEPDVVRQVKKQHERAYRDKWSEDEASKAILRAHGTSVSARNIYRITNELKRNRGAFSLPVKLFTVGRVFRNENLDFKHLADFYQTDGIVIGRNLTLSNLFDYLLRIYAKLGVKIRFTPAFFPFVEPGVEIQVLRNGQWLELGGAGMIRTEITGVSRKQLTVLAWGLGVERVLLVNDPEIKSIVELYNNGIGWARKKALV